MRHTKFFILLGLPFLCFAQQRKTIDSLLTLLKTNTEDTLQVRRLNFLADNYTVIKPDSNIFYSTKALALSKKLRFKDGEAHASQILSSGYKIKGEYPLAWEHLQQAKKLYSELKDNERLLFMEFAEGTLTHTEGENKEALVIFLRLKPAFESQGSTTAQHNRMSLYNFLAQTYLNLKQTDSAIYFARKAYNLDPDKRSFGSDWPLGIIADAYFLKNEFDSTFKYRRQEYLFSQYHNVPNTYAVLGLAEVFFKKGNIDSSLWYAHLAFSMAGESARNTEIISTSLFLAELYEKLNPSEAIHYYKIGYSLKDSVFSQEKARQVQNLKHSAMLRDRDEKEKERENSNRLQRYLFTAGLIALAIITLLLVRNNRHKKQAHDRVTRAYTELKDAQRQLIQREKMASLGELTAGIAHEIQNPLNFVNNFSDVNTELVDELQQQLNVGKIDEAIIVANDIKDNNAKINHHGKRADAIVKSMLQHSRSNRGEEEKIDINALTDEYLKLAYHGLRAKDNSFNVTMRAEFDNSIGKINIITQDIGRVILNLVTNAFYAVTEKKKQLPNEYDPTVTVSTKKLQDKVEIKVGDNGNGIPEKYLDKIFQPFFTTKPTGQGTGLGLSLSYDIVKAHGGEIRVETKEGYGSEFVIELPLNK